MEQILDHADSEEKAAELAAIYLKENLSRFFRYTSFDIYLKILPSPKVIEYLDKENVKSAESSVRGIIKRANEKWNGIKEKKEILKEPPLPKAKSTENIYANTLLINNDRPAAAGAMNDIRILAPSVDEKTYQKILKILGMTGKSDGFNKSNWPQLFKVNDDRLSLVGVSGDNIASHHGGRASTENREHIQEIESLKERAKLAGVREEKNHDNVLYLNYTDHSNISRKAASSGLMFEILLQRLNVPYFVNNRYCGKEYQYDPETNKITMPLNEQLNSIQNILVKSGLSGIEQELIKRGIDEKNIKTHLDKKPSERQLIFGDPSKAILKSLPDIITKLMEGELDKERQKTLRRIKSELEWSTEWSFRSAEFYLHKLKREALELLRGAIYDSDDIDTAKILDLSTDYIVLDKLLEETREKIG